MKTSKTEFPFSRARRVNAQEVELARKAIEKKLSIKLPPRGRPAKPKQEKYLSISIRVHPRVLRWAKQEAKKRKMKYQSIINECLLKMVS